MGEYSAAMPMFAYHESCKPDAIKGKRVLNNILQDIQKYANYGSLRIEFDRPLEHQYTAWIRPVGFKERWLTYWNKTDYSPTGRYKITITTDDITYVIDKLKYLGYNIIDHNLDMRQVSFVIDWTKP